MSDFPAPSSPVFGSYFRRGDLRRGELLRTSFFLDFSRLCTQEVETGLAVEYDGDTGKFHFADECGGCTSPKPQLPLPPDNSFFSLRKISQQSTGAEVASEKSDRSLSVGSAHCRPLGWLRRGRAADEQTSKTEPHSGFKAKVALAAIKDATACLD